MSEATNSPLPWRVQAHPGGNGDGAPWVWVTAADGTYVYPGPCAFGRMSLEDAALIVRAVNNYEALVTACRQIAEDPCQDWEPPTSCITVNRPDWNMCPSCAARAALALAEGREQATPAPQPAPRDFYGTDEACSTQAGGPL